MTMSHDLSRRLIQQLAGHGTHALIGEVVCVRAEMACLILRLRGTPSRGTGQRRAADPGTLSVVIYRQDALAQAVDTIVGGQVAYSRLRRLP